MATNLGIQPDPTKVYAYRLYSLITDGGGFVYRAVFTDYATRMSGSVPEHIQMSNDAIGQSLLRNDITRIQFDTLFPNRSPASSADNFDLTLLAFLVRTTCVDVTADEELRKRVASLDKLRRFRNEIVHIHSTEVYDEAKFEDVWRRIRLKMLQLGAGIPGLEEEIDKLKSDPIDPHREAELQEIIIDLRRRAECAQELSTRLERLEIKQDRLEQGQILTNNTVSEVRQGQIHTNDIVREVRQAQIHTSNIVSEVRGKLDDTAISQEQNQKALLEQLQQIVKNPFLQLPSPGDFQCDSGVYLSITANQGPSSSHLLQTQRFTQTDDKTGYRYVETHQKMLTKGTVTALGMMDYDDLFKLIGIQWSSLASHLGLSDRQIQRIKTSVQPNDIRAHIVEMVRIWGETEQEHATIERLIQIVLGCPLLAVTESDLEEIIKRHK